MAGGAVGVVGFRVLGPLEVEVDGQALDLGGQKQRALLAVLLLEANRVVSAERLIDALWEEQPPETARKALQVYVSQLRRLVGKERIERRASGYRLRVAVCELDLERFRGLLAERRFAEALSLWRGPPLAEFSGWRFAQPERARLEELWLGCLEERVESDLEAGCHGDVVGELEALVREHPLRERLWAQLMLALYRCGRQAEALASYRAARQALVEGLGIDPSRRLRELEQAILRQDAGLELAAQPELSEAAPSVQPEWVSPLRRGVRKTVSVLFVAVRVASVGGDALDPETTRWAEGEARREIEAAVRLHDGTFEGVAGDAVTAVFGLPVAHEDDAVRAVQAAGSIRARLAVLERELVAERGIAFEFRIGVSTGRVIAVGEGAQLSPSGAPLTAAARLGRAGKAGELLVDEPTRRLLRDAAAVEPARPVSGGAFRVIDVIEQPPAHRIRLAAPMIGRERERRQLRDAFEQAIADSSCLLFTILGAAGVGKSRLVQEFLGEVAGRSLVARGRCLPYGEGITYWPLSEAVKEAARPAYLGGPEESVRTLAALIADEADDAGSIARAVAGLTGLTEMEAGAEQAFEAVGAFFAALAGRRPLVLVFDDIQWAEPGFLDLIEYVADETRGRPILLICLARPELLDLRPGWAGGKLHATSTLLEPLSEAESNLLVSKLAGSTRLAAPVRRRIVAAAEGNPLFVEEMLALALEVGWEESEPEVPPTIQALLAARLDRLPVEERSVVEAAAVEGQLFHAGSVAELLLDPAQPSLQAHLRALVRRDVVRPERPLFAGEHAYRFRHLLIRDAAYDAIPMHARAAMHARHAAWLERLTRERSGEYAEIIGYHLERASHYRAELDPGDPEAGELARRAAGHLGSAGRRAFIRSDAPAAVNLVSRAAALLPADDPARVDLIPTARVVLGMRGDLGWAEAILSQAIATGDERVRAHARVQQGLLRLFTEPGVSPNELLEAGDAAASVFERVRDELGLARAWRLIAQAHYLARHAAACAAASETAFVHAREANDPFEIKETVEWLALALVLGPAPASQASHRCEQLLEHAVGDPALRVILYSACAYLEAIRGRASQARELIERARHAIDDPSQLHRIDDGFFAWCAGSVHASNPAVAEHELRAGCQALEEVGEKTNYSSLTAALARAVHEQGRSAEAETLTKISEQATHANDVWSNISWRSVRATVLAQQGELEAAEALAREAIAIAQKSDFLSLHGDALVTLAAILQPSRRLDEAGRALRRAIELYEQKEHLLGAAAARSRLPA